MSAPAPGSSPPPQSPPPYPPPQGYPPQYPPQQPYAPPPTPPPKESHTALIVVLVVVVVVVVVAAVVAYIAIQGFMSSGRQLTQVTVTGVSFSIGGPASTYFNPSPLTTCSACPKTVTVGQTFQFSLALTNHDTAASHMVTNVNVTYPFLLMSLSPSLPVTVSAGNSVTFTLTIEAATLGGSYTLTGDIVVAS